MNPSTGLISGTPTTAGASSVTITATDSSGPSSSTTFDWTIGNKPGPSWSAPKGIDDGHQLNSVSCPSSSFCAAVDNDGNLLTYTDGSWSSPSPTGNQLKSVSCPSSSFCEAVGYDNKGGNGFVTS
ncbi:MAG: Ig domain-containing protein [Solirubrobacteraceae bacterium]